MSAHPLQQLLEDGIVDEVVQQLKSGKEADVFLVRKGDDLLAAKVYKARDQRNFKNNAGYLEGRQVRSSRDQRAIDKGSRFGRAKSESAWKTAEVDALYKLSAAGARVPAPNVFYEGVLVMALVTDAEGFPAPRLADVRISPEEALSLHHELLRQIVVMLTCDLIHGDLSAFNVLLAREGPTIIDLPQVVSAPHNSQSETFLRRDVRNITQFLGQFAPVLLSRPDGGADIWNRYQRGELFPGYVPDTTTLRDEAPRAHSHGTGPGHRHAVKPPRPRPPSQGHRGRHGSGGPEVIQKGAQPRPAGLHQPRGGDRPPRNRPAGEPTVHGNRRSPPPIKP